MPAYYAHDKHIAFIRALRYFPRPVNMLRSAKNILATVRQSYGSRMEPGRGHGTGTVNACFVGGDF